LVKLIEQFIRRETSKKLGDFLRKKYSKSI
jgi:hypothetical protein